MFYLKTLTIAGSDSCGGAGIQADIKTMSALGCYAASVITSVTAQNTKGVYAIQQVAPDVVAAQLHAVLDDLHPCAIKVGMLNDAATIQVVADALSPYTCDCLIVDPVMVSTSGCRLIQEDAVEVFRRRLLPMATILTPNIPEAAVLSNLNIQSDDALDEAAKIIMKQFAGALLIKGGHATGSVKADRLYMQDGSCTIFKSKTIATKNTHGTGCTLSSAIAAFAARGEHLAEAVRLAKAYITEAIASGSDVDTGEGFGPVNHFFNPEKLIKI